MTVNDLRELLSDLDGDTIVEIEDSNNNVVEINSVRVTYYAIDGFLEPQLLLITA